MGLFGNKEEKELRKSQKEEEKVQKFLKYYNLEELDERDKNNIIDMLGSNNAIKMLSFGNFLSGNEKDFLEQLTYQQEFQRDQLFLIIKQLDRLNKNIERLLEK